MKAKKIILSYKAPGSLKDFISKLGIEMVITLVNEHVYPSIQDHPDIFIFQSKEGFVVEPRHFAHYLKYVDEGMIFKGTIEVGHDYPLNTSYNAVLVGDVLIHGNEVESNILSQYPKNILVKQAYCRCNILPVDDHSFITSDRGIFKKTKDFFDVLLIEPGHIVLDRMPYGFIGGTGGRISSNEILFTGNIERHPDYKKIEAFLEKRQIKMIYPKTNELVDLGSIIPVFEVEE